MMKVRKLAKVVAFGATLLLGLIGCAQKSAHDQNAKVDLDDSVSMTKTAGLGESIDFYGESITPEAEQALLAKDRVHFAYDRFDITGENKRIIFAHAKKLLANPNLRLRVEGNTDERGSREYNIALGERRAKAVARVLALKGISEDRVITVSYGKEKPVALGHIESSWWQNRRAEFHYEGSEG